MLGRRRTSHDGLGSRPVRPGKTPLHLVMNFRAENSMVVSLRLESRTVSATFTSMEPLLERSKEEDRDDG